MKFKLKSDKEFTEDIKNGPSFSIFLIYFYIIIIHFLIHEQKLSVEWIEQPECITDANQDSEINQFEDRTKRDITVRGLHRPIIIR